jgi:hypothetical protein
MAHYKVLSFDKDTGSLVVQFAENMEPLSIDVPINEAGLFVTGQELDQYIQGFIPTWHLERLEKLKNGISNAADIEALVDLTQEAALPSTPQVQVNEEEIANRQMWADLAFKRNVSKVLVEFGLLDTDPTQIPTATL